MIKFGAVAARWNERSGGALEMAALAAPWNLLADRRFGRGWRGLGRRREGEDRGDPAGVSTGSEREPGSTPPRRDAMGEVG